jgi:hypothetical protein
MNAPTQIPAQVSEELEKAASMVTTARRLLATGTMVDLSALEGKVRFICDALAGMAREDGRALMPIMERLISDLDHLAEAITERVEPPPPPFSLGGGA